MRVFGPASVQTLTEREVLGLLSAVPDPELGIGIVDLGLIYRLDIDGDVVRIEMTMTTPACPLHAYLGQQVQEAIRTGLSEVKSVEVVLVWEPPWQPKMMSAEARRRLGWPE